MMTVNQAIDCVRSEWNVTCPVGQKQAALALMNEVVWLRLQFAAIEGIVNNGVSLPAREPGIDDGFRSQNGSGFPRTDCIVG